MNTTSPLAGKVILVVDDEELMREIIADAFRGLGATVIEASNGRDAFEIVSQQEISLIFSDARMPGGDGITLIEEICAKLGKRPVFFLCSGYSDFSTEQK